MCQVVIPKSYYNCDGLSAYFQWVEGVCFPTMYEMFTPPVAFKPEMNSFL